MNSFRDKLKDKKRIVIKIGSSSLTHEKTGELNLFKIEKLIRVICDLKGEGKDVVLVSSGAIAAGRHGGWCWRIQRVRGLRRTKKARARAIY